MKSVKYSNLRQPLTAGAPHCGGDPLQGRCPRYSQQVPDSVADVDALAEQLINYLEREDPHIAVAAAATAIGNLLVERFVDPYELVPEVVSIVASNIAQHDEHI